MKQHDQKVAQEVQNLVLRHTVVTEWDHNYGFKPVIRCFTCGYFGNKEDPSLHAGNIVLEYLEGYYEERLKGEKEDSHTEGP